MALVLEAACISYLKSPQSILRKCCTTWWSSLAFRGTAVLLDSLASDKGRRWPSVVKTKSWMSTRELASSANRRYLRQHNVESIKHTWHAIAKIWKKSLQVLERLWQNEAVHPVFFLKSADIFDGGIPTCHTRMLLQAEKKRINAFVLIVPKLKLP